METPPGFWAGGLGSLPSKGKRQAAQGAEHAPNENMLTYQCTTLGATVFCFGIASRPKSPKTRCFYKF